jgi:hypothetical protein
MLSPTGGVLRGLRTASLGVTGFVLALMAHVAAGGGAPGPVALLLLAGLIGLGTFLLTGVRLSPLRVEVSLSAMQVLLHEVFMLLGAPAGCLMPGMSPTAGGHVGHCQPILGSAISIAQAQMGQRSMFAAPAMVGAHVAATALMVALLAHGEKVLWLLLAGYVRPPPWLRVGPPGLPAVWIIASGASRNFRARFVYGGASRRGPPPRSLFAFV